MRTAYWIRKIAGVCYIVGAINAQGWITRTGDTLPVNDPWTWDFYTTEAFIGVTGTGQWLFVESKLGVNGPDSMSGTNVVSQEFYKLEVEVP